MAKRRKRKKKKKKEKAVGYQPPCNIIVQEDDDVWESDVEIVEQCSRVSGNGNVTVWVEPLAKLKIDALMEKYTNQEWLGYLLGKKDDNVIEDIFIPEQVASSTRVDEVECDAYNELPIIGVIHSHHGMGTGFSHTDHTYINQNHDISLVVAKNGIDGQIRVKVPCGSLMVSKVKVRLKLDCNGFNKEKFIEKIENNIKKKTYCSTFYTQPPMKGHQRPGFWYNGQYQEYEPNKDKERFWTCKKCSTQNWSPKTENSTCWWCDRKQSNEKNKNHNGIKWKCRQCGGINTASQKSKCLYCNTLRKTLTLAEKNQKKIEEEWEKSITNTKPRSSKVLGSYTCGRCGGYWKNIDLSKFTNCPNCDRIV